MYLGRADMLCPPVVSGFVPLPDLRAAAKRIFARSPRRKQLHVQSGRHGFIVRPSGNFV